MKWWSSRTVIAETTISTMLMKSGWFPSRYPRPRYFQASILRSCTRRNRLLQIVYEFSSFCDSSRLSFLSCLRYVFAHQKELYVWKDSEKVIDQLDITHNSKQMHYLQIFSFETFLASSTYEGLSDRSYLGKTLYSNSRRESTSREALLQKHKNLRPRRSVHHLVSLMSIVSTQCWQLSLVNI